MPINTNITLCTENSPSLTCYINTRVHDVNSQTTVPSLCSSLLTSNLLPLEHRKTTVQGESKSKMPNMYELNNLLISTTQANYKTFTTPNWWQRHAWCSKAKILSGHKKKGLRRCEICQKCSLLVIARGLLQSMSHHRFRARSSLTLRDRGFHR